MFRYKLLDYALRIVVVLRLHQAIGAALQANERRKNPPIVREGDTLS